MVVLTFIFTQVFAHANSLAFAVLCALVPLNVFALDGLTGTRSILDNALLIKKVPVRRQIFPIASVLSICMHLTIQIALLLADHYFRAWTKYSLAVAAGNLVPGNHIRYGTGTSVLGDEHLRAGHGLNQINPVAALVLMMRNALLEERAPLASTFIRLTIASILIFTAGWFVFGKLKDGFYSRL